MIEYISVMVHLTLQSAYTAEHLYHWLRLRLTFLLKRFPCARYVSVIRTLHQAVLFSCSWLCLDAAVATCLDDEQLHCMSRFL
jgi:hypothetical protein